MQPKKLGYLSELQFRVIMLQKGYTVSVPEGDDDPYDCIIEKDGFLRTVQVKATRKRDTRGYKDEYVCGTCRGRGCNVMYDTKRVDLFAIHVVPVDAWYLIPAEKIKSTGIRVYPHKKPKSSKFERYRFK